MSPLGDDPTLSIYVPCTKCEEPVLRDLVWPKNEPPLCDGCLSTRFAKRMELQRELFDKLIGVEVIRDSRLC